MEIQCQTRETTLSQTKELAQHPPEELIGLDPGLPTPSLKEVLQDHQEGNNTHPHLPADHQIKGTDPSQKGVEDHLSLTVKKTVAGQQMTAKAETEVRIPLTAIKAMLAQIPLQVK